MYRARFYFMVASGRKLHCEEFLRMDEAEAFLNRLKTANHPYTLYVWEDTSKQWQMSRASELTNRILSGVAKYASRFTFIYQLHGYICQECYEAFPGDKRKTYCSGCSIRKFGYRSMLAA